MTTKEIKITTKEFEAYCQAGGSTVSDLDYFYNRETGYFDIPAVEWDSVYGTHWVRYDSEEDRGEALDIHDDQMAYWVLGYREEQKAKRAKAREVAKLRTLGGQFPELEKLREKVAS